MRLLPFVVCAPLLLAFTSAGPQPLIVHASSLQWQSSPAFAAGAEVAMVQGDMTKPGPFIARLRIPAGFKIAPHWHSQAENVTILSGSAQFGMGETFDLSGAVTLSAGDYASMPAGHRHFVQSLEPSVVQIHGEGPFDIHYVNPADDPRLHSEMQ